MPGSEKHLVPAGFKDGRFHPGASKELNRGECGFARKDGFAEEDFRVGRDVRDLEERRCPAVEGFGAFRGYARRAQTEEARVLPVVGADKKDSTCGGARR